MELCMLMMFHFFLQEVPASCRTRNMWAAGVSYIAFPPYLLQLPKKGSLSSLGILTPDNFSVSHLFYVFYLSFLCTHTPFHALWPFCLSCLCLPISHSLFLQLPFSQLLSLFLSPFAPSVWPFHVTRSHKDSSCSVLWFPLFSDFPVCHSLPLLLYHWNSVSLCFFIFGSVCLWLLLHVHTFHIKTLLPNPFKFELLSVSVLFPRQKYVPRCCVPEMSVKVACACTCEMCWTYHAYTGDT